MDKRTKKYRSKLEKRTEFWRQLALWLLGFSLACIAYIVFMSMKTAKAYEAMTVISPFVSNELADDKNTHCKGEYEKLFCNSKYSWDAKKMIAIAKCESGMNPEAFNLNTNGTMDSGLLQVNSVHGYKPSDLFDPVKNVALGYEVFLSQGYDAWVVNNSNCYYQQLASL